MGWAADAVRSGLLLSSPLDERRDIPPSKAGISLAWLERVADSIKGLHSSSDEDEDDDGDEEGDDEQPERWTSDSVFDKLFQPACCRRR